jgi:hypothetical protein
MNTLGGMSGGPVFNARGHLVGIVSSSYVANDGKGPTYVSLIWPAFHGTVDATWPKDFWPDKEASILAARERGHAKVCGDFEIDARGVIVLHTEFEISETGRMPSGASKEPESG